MFPMHQNRIFFFKWQSESIDLTDVSDISIIVYASYQGIISKKDNQVSLNIVSITDKTK